MKTQVETRRAEQKLVCYFVDLSSRRNEHFDSFSYENQSFSLREDFPFLLFRKFHNCFDEKLDVETFTTFGFSSPFRKHPPTEMTRTIATTDTR